MKKAIRYFAYGLITVVALSVLAKIFSGSGESFSINATCGWLRMPFSSFSQFQLTSEFETFGVFAVEPFCYIGYWWQIVLGTVLQSALMGSIIYLIASAWRKLFPAS